MKAIILRKWAIPMLTLLLSFAGICGANAQITEISADGTTATVYIYVRFSNQAEVRKPTLNYWVGSEFRQWEVTHDRVEHFFGKGYYVFKCENIPYNQAEKRLENPIYIQSQNLRWRESVLSSTHNNVNTIELWGDSFLYMLQRNVLLARYDFATVDEDMEQDVMYEYDAITGKSTMFSTDARTGTCSKDIDMQSMRNVEEDMQNYNNIYDRTFIFARKSAYKSYQFTIDYCFFSLITSAASHSLDLSNNDDVFYASIDDGGTNNNVLFNNFYTAEIAERNWPEGCTADYSCRVQSYLNHEGDYKGFVGHLNFIINARDKTWKTEAWLEHKSDNVDGWGTFSTPYNVTVPEGLLVLSVIEDDIKPEGEQVNPETSLTEYVPGRIYMVSMIDYPYVPAETGVLAKGRGTYHFRPWTDTADPSIYSENKMQYVALENIDNLPYKWTDPVTETEYTHYVFTYSNKKPKFLRAIPDADDSSWMDNAATGHIPPFRSYLRIESSKVTGSGAPSRELIAVMSDEADGIETVTNTPTKASDTYYDLTGRPHAPSVHSLKSGIYVVNGRKHIVR